MEKVYTPIACGLYDQLEIWAMRRKEVSIVYDDGHGPVTISDRIKDLTQKDKAECMVLEQHEEIIRLDDLISVEGISFASAEACKIQ
ncbi:MAG: Rho-binding antiterminator [Bacteroidota bacterium]